MFQIGEFPASCMFTLAAYLTRIELFRSIYSFIVMPYISLDFGASTTDIVVWKNGEIEKIFSFEPEEIPKALEDFLLQQKKLIKDVDKIYVTGGRSRSIPDIFQKIPIVKVSEIEAIGRGGMWLVAGVKSDNLLVVSMGTGTCMVKCQKSKIKSQKSGQNSKAKISHIGGTGIGGGTFLALAREILGVTDIGKLICMFKKGDRWRVDLSVEDIVGGGIGIVPGNVTASNLGKLSRDVWQGEEIKFSNADKAAGIANLIGQTIATAAVFAARAEGVKTIVLGGKLSRIEKITEIIFEVGKIYNISIILPKNADYVSAIGAGALQETRCKQMIKYHIH